MSLTFLTDAQWHEEPPAWDLSDGVLTVETGDKTDFWQDTFYGFRRDDGHFFGVPVKGDFTAIVTFEGNYETLYDQAGMMMRVDAQNWLKTGIEYSDDITNFSVVITRNGRSDWSTMGVPRVSGPQSVRLTRLSDAVIVHFRGADGTWQLLRLGDFPAAETVTLGPMACSPQRQGFRARFLSFDVGDPIDSPLHGAG